MRNGAEFCLCRFSAPDGARGIDGSSGQLMAGGTNRGYASSPDGVLSSVVGFWSWASIVLLCDAISSSTALGAPGQM